MSGDEFFVAKFPDVNSRALRMVTVVFKQGLQLPKDSTPISSFQAKYSLTAATTSSTLRMAADFFDNDIRKQLKFSAYCAVVI